MLTIWDSVGKGEIIYSVDPNISVLAVKDGRVRFERESVGIFRSLLRRDASGRLYFVTGGRRHYLYKGIIGGDGVIKHERGIK